jgi:hypothetical protein
MVDAKMSDEKRAVLGETLRDEFQVLLKGHITGYLCHNPLSPEDCREFHILEAQMNQFAETIHGLTALAIRLSTVFFPAAPTGCQSKTTLSDKEPTPSFRSFENAPQHPSVSDSAEQGANRIPPDKGYDPYGIEGVPERTSPAFAKPDKRPAAGISGHSNPGSEVTYRFASRHRHEIPSFEQSMSPSSERYPETIDPVSTGVGSKSPLQSSPAEIHGPMASFPDHFPQLTPQLNPQLNPQSKSIAKAGIPSGGIGSSHGRQTPRAFTSSRKGQAAPCSPADKATAPQKDSDGEFLSIEDTHAMPAGSPPVASQGRSVKGLRDLARFVKSRPQGELCMRSERGASHRSQKCVSTSDVAVMTGYRASGPKTTNQGTGDGFDDTRPNKTAPFAQTAASIRQQQPVLYDAQISNPGSPVLEEPPGRNRFRAHREQHKTRTDIASGGPALLATSLKIETGAERLFVQEGCPWLERPDGIPDSSKDEGLDNIMEALAREIRREYQRFYGD